MNNETENNTASLEVMPASALEAITRGEIDVQVATAHRYPRSLDLYKKRAIFEGNLHKMNSLLHYYYLYDYVNMRMAEDQFFLHKQ